MLAFTNITTIATATIEELSAVSGIGTLLAKNVHNYFRIPANLRRIDKFRKIGLQMENTDSTEHTPNRRYALTGKVPNITKQQARCILKEKGAVLDSSITKMTDALLVGDYSTVSRKYKRAVELGIPIIPAIDILAN